MSFNSYWLHFGLWGLALGMILESAGVPVPSEVLLPLAGFLVAKGAIGLLPAVLLMALMQTLGSWVGYAIGYYGGRPLALRFGRYLLLDRHSLDRAEDWFGRFGPGAVFFSRFLPVVRTFISWPAGFAQMRGTRFTVYTFLGSLPWTAALIYAGYWFGPRYARIEPLLAHYNKLFGVAVAVLLVLFVWWRVRVARRTQ